MCVCVCMYPFVFIYKYMDIYIQDRHIRRHTMVGMLAYTFIHDALHFNSGSKITHHYEPRLEVSHALSCVGHHLDQEAHSTRCRSCFANLTVGSGHHRQAPRGCCCYSRITNLGNDVGQDRQGTLLESHVPPPSTVFQPQGMHDTTSKTSVGQILCIRAQENLELQHGIATDLASQEVFDGANEDPGYVYTYIQIYICIYIHEFT